MTNRPASQSPLTQPNKVGIDTPIPDSAAPPPTKPPGMFSIGSPLFNIGLVCLLMAITFAAVALPERADVETITEPPPANLAFAATEATTTTTTTTTEAQSPPTTALDNGLLSELLVELQANGADLQDQTSNGATGDEPIDGTTEAVDSPQARSQELVQVVYRTEQIIVPASTVPPAPKRPECTDYDTRSQAQVAFDADPTGLAHFDGDGDGNACEQLADPDAVSPVSCNDFQSQPDAQALFDANSKALAYLDGDGDGRACEQLPGAPVQGPAPPPAAQVLSVNAVREQQGVFGMHTREAPWWMGELDYVTRLVGKAPNNLLFFSNWSTPFPAEQVRTAWGRGMTPQVAWEPSIPGADTQPTLQQISDGTWDFYIDEWAAAAAAHGQPIVLRLAAEMNGSWYSWSEGVNGNQEGDFVEMWRHVHDRFALAGADNVVWLWSVNRSDNLKTDIANYWPGEEYVDWVGMSGYWRGYQGAEAPTFDAVFGKTLGELRALTAKPILLAEIGAGTNVNDDRVTWLNTLFTGLGANPDIIGFVYFNDSKSGGDWRIQFSQPMVDAFAAGVADDRWKSGALPTGMKIGDRLSVPAHSDPNNDDLASDE